MGKRNPFSIKKKRKLVTTMADISSFYMYVYTYTHTHIYFYMYMYISVYLYMHINQYISFHVHEMVRGGSWFHNVQCSHQH